MSNVKEVRQKTPMQIAKEEIAAEEAKHAVTLLKDKMRELHKAQTIVANIEREMADLEQQIEDGNV